jgi:hypothetical protein
VVNAARVTSARPSRVYTIGAACLLTLLASLAVLGDRPAAQTGPELGADPVMVKGPPTAAVTIVEFSDYQ